jgi:hypothetical protein
MRYNRDHTRSPQSHQHTVHLAKLAQGEVPC